MDSKKKSAHVDVELKVALSMEGFEFVTSKVLAKIFQFVVNGDIRAAELYFEEVGSLKDQEQNGISAALKTITSK